MTLRHSLLSSTRIRFYPEPEPGAQPPAPEPAPPAPVPPAPDAPVAVVVEPPAPEAPKPDAPVAPEAPKAAHETPSLAETAGAPPKEEAKPEGDKPADGAPKPDAKPGDQPQPQQLAPVDYKYELPDGMSFKAEEIGPVNEIFAKHKIPQEDAQALVSQATTAMKDYAAHLSSEQHRVFSDTRATWRKEVMADQILGGAGHQTAMGVVGRMRDMFVPKEMLAPRTWQDGKPRESEFSEFCRVTGAGDHPVFNRIMHAIGARFDEPAPAPNPHSPPPDAGKKPGGRRAAMYDHPSSQAHRNGARQ